MENTIFRSVSKEAIDSHLFHSKIKWPFRNMEVGSCIIVEGRENFEKAKDAYKAHGRRHGMHFSRVTKGNQMLIKREA